MQPARAPMLQLPAPKTHLAPGPQLGPVRKHARDENQAPQGTLAQAPQLLHSMPPVPAYQNTAEQAQRQLQHLSLSKGPTEHGASAAASPALSSQQEFSFGGGLAARRGVARPSLSPLATGVGRGSADSGAGTSSSGPDTPRLLGGALAGDSTAPTLAAAAFEAPQGLPQQPSGFSFTPQAPAAAAVAGAAAQGHPVSAAMPAPALSLEPLRCSPAASSPSLQGRQTPGEELGEEDDTFDEDGIIPPTPGCGDDGEQSDDDLIIPGKLRALSCTCLQSAPLPCSGLHLWNWVCQHGTWKCQ